ncbi:MAG: arylesterase [Pseudomonadota bacterium]
MDLSYGAFGAGVERLLSRARVFMVAAAGIMMAMSGPLLAQTPDSKDVKPIKLAVLGDSLTAGFGLPASDAFPAKLQKALRDKGILIDILNAGVSGDTTTAGRDRLDWSIPPGTEAVIVELGANDALRGVDPQVARGALDDILKKLRARNIAVLLCGMLAPPNYGTDYAARFNSIYPDLAKSYKVPLYPFFLDGVATIAKLTQPDGLHPTAAGIDVIVERILPTVEAFLKDHASQVRQP